MLRNLLSAAITICWCQTALGYHGLGLSPESVIFVQCIMYHNILCCKLVQCDFKQGQHGTLHGLCPAAAAWTLNKSWCHISGLRGWMPGPSIVTHKQHIWVDIGLHRLSTAAALFSSTRASYSASSVTTLTPPLFANALALITQPIVCISRTFVPSTPDGGNLHLITTKDESTISLSETIFAPSSSSADANGYPPHFTPSDVAFIFYLAAVPSLYLTVFVISCPLPLHFLPRAFPTNSKYKTDEIWNTILQNNFVTSCLAQSTLPAKLLSNQEFLYCCTAQFSVW